MQFIQAYFPGLKADSANFLGLVGIISLILGMLVPMPGVMLDFLMVINLAFAIVIIMIVLMNQKVVQFSIFPQLLLVTTFFSLMLNVSSTRSILSLGSEFDGNVIRAFASFVTGASSSDSGAIQMVVGTIIFIIIVAVQLVVLTKGATRVAEVAARFTLDALPTKSMGIDQEFAQGVISEEEAKTKKAELQKESDFFAAMDGSTKFVSGSAKVGILITAINLIGGLIVGLVIKGYDFDEAINTYLLLTIGDGLVSQFPAFFINVATGFIVTRSSSDSSFGDEIVGQFAKFPIVYYVSGAFIILMGLIPAFNFFIFAFIGIVLIGFGYWISHSQKLALARANESAAKPVRPKEGAESVTVKPYELIMLELGFGLTPFVNKEAVPDFLDRITRLRKNIANELGVQVPTIRIGDNPTLKPEEYSIKLSGIELGNGELRRGSYLAIQGQNVIDPLDDGIKTIDPTFGLPAIWISVDQKDSAERRGYMVVDGPSIIVTHLNTVLKANAPDLVTRQAVADKLNERRDEIPSVIDELLVQYKYNVGNIQKILQLLVEENISIRNIDLILETIANYLQYSQDPYYLCNRVRQRLCRQIIKNYITNKADLNVIVVDSALDRKIFETSNNTTNGPMPGISPIEAQKMITSYVEICNDMGLAANQQPLPIVVSEESRWAVRRIFKEKFPSLTILSHSELPAGVNTSFVGVIEVKKEEMMA